MALQHRALGAAVSSRWPRITTQETALLEALYLVHLLRAWSPAVSNSGLLATAPVELSHDAAPHDRSDSSRHAPPDTLDQWSPTTRNPISKRPCARSSTIIATAACGS
jgi:hypothetical protein